VTETVPGVGEELDNPTLLGYSLAFRANCLLECEEFAQARLDAVRSATLLTEQPKAAKEMFLYAYEVGERAWSHLTGKAAQ
jgi:hypothetical protein